MEGALVPLLSSLTQPYQLGRGIALPIEHLKGQRSNPFTTPKSPCFPVCLLARQVTDLYEWGWGQSFHFSPKLPIRDWSGSEAAHEARIGAILGLAPGKVGGEVSGVAWVTTMTTIITTKGGME